MAGKQKKKAAVEGTSGQKRALRRAKQQLQLRAASSNGKGRPNHTSTTNARKAKQRVQTKKAGGRRRAAAVRHHGDAMVITKAEYVIPMFEVNYGATCNYSYGQRIAPGSSTVPSAGLNAKGLRNVGCKRVGRRKQGHARDSYRYTRYAHPETADDCHIRSLQRQEKRKRIHNHRSAARAEKFGSRDYL